MDVVRETLRDALCDAFCDVLRDVPRGRGEGEGLRDDRLEEPSLAADCATGKAVGLALRLCRGLGLVLDPVRIGAGGANSFSTPWNSRMSETASKFVLQP